MVYSVATCLGKFVSIVEYPSLLSDIMYNNLIVGTVLYHEPCTVVVHNRKFVKHTITTHTKNHPRRLSGVKKFLTNA